MPDELGPMRIFTDIPAIWRESSRRAITALMLRHPDKSFTDISAMIFTAGVTQILDADARHLRRRQSDFED
jgi:hypothetical protein